MNEPYVLGTLRRMLAIYDRTGILSESSDVYKGLVGVGQADKAEYLKNYRENYFAVFTALSDEEKPFRVEASLDSLVVFWNDSHQRFVSANDGIGMDGVVWSLIKTYHQETVYFICFLYRCSLLFPTDELYDIEGKFKGLQLKDVHQVIYDAGLLTLKRIDSLEEQIKKTSKKKEPFGGKILGIPWSGEPEIDSISDYFDDSSVLNMPVITEMGKKFRQLCRSKARDKGLSVEEKIIWIRAVVNSLNALYSQSKRSNMDRITELTGAYCAIVEEEFMQIPNPICVKKLAIEIGAVEIFDDVMFTVGINEDGSAGMCTFNRFLLTEDLGLPTLELYEKKLCLDCGIINCPYDIYLRKYQEDGVGIPGKYDFNSPQPKTDDEVSKEHKSAEDGDIDMFRRCPDIDNPNGEHPELIPCEYQIQDIPRCNVPEVDNLAIYYDDSKKYAKYYSLEAEDSFAKTCWARVDDKSNTVKSNIRWARRVLQTLDSTYFIADGEKPEIQYQAVVLATILEGVFMQADTPICLKKIAMESDLTIILQESVLLKKEKGHKATPAEEARFDGWYRTVGGNICLFEKEMCDLCDFADCPYRLMNYSQYDTSVNIPGRDEDEDVVEDVPAQDQPDIETEPDPKELFKKYLDVVCESLGEDYAVKINRGNYEWEFKGTSLSLAYLCLALANRCGATRVPWSYVNSRIYNRAGCNYLKEKASRMRKGDEMPSDKDVVDVAVGSIRMD